MSWEAGESWEQAGARGVSWEKGEPIRTGGCTEACTDM